MDSTNFHHHHHQQQQQQHHLQDHFVGYGVSTSLNWNDPITMLSTSRASSNKLYDNEFQTTGDSGSDQNTLSSTSISTITDAATRNLSYPASNLPKIEEDMLSSFPSFSSLINSCIAGSENCWPFNSALASSSPQYGRGLMQLPLDNNNKDHQSSYNNNINNWSGQPNHGFGSASFVNQLGLVSSPNSATSVTSSPRLGLNLQSMGFLGNNAGFSNQNRPVFDVGDNEAVSQAERIMSNKTLVNGVTGTKRAAGSYSSDQPKASSSNITAATKKSQSKVSCPPFKVRKEKLGDRIAALHQMVSPFGKTDTASVLTEAIGYIQFLQDQIQTLCMPHAKPSRNKPCRPFQMGSGIEEQRKEETRIDLQRRGLCLVPASWTSYIMPTQLDASNPSYF